MHITCRVGRRVESTFVGSRQIGRHEKRRRPKGVMPGYSPRHGSCLPALPDAETAREANLDAYARFRDAKNRGWRRERSTPCVKMLPVRHAAPEGLGGPSSILCAGKHSVLVVSMTRGKPRDDGCIQRGPAGRTGCVLVVVLLGVPTGPRRARGNEEQTCFAHSGRSNR